MRHREDHDERDEIELLETLVDIGLVTIELLKEINAKLSTLGEATTGVLSLGGKMPVQVGATETATLSFVDASGNPAATPAGDGSGIVVTFASDNTGVATVGAGVVGAQSATTTVTGVAEGTYNLSADVANTSGAPLNDDDGVTPFIQAAPLADSVSAPPPPQATTGVLSVG